MCGICGIVTTYNDSGPGIVQKMNAHLTHRGPDGEGYFHSQHISLGMRRLSIIGLNDGWQPIFNEDKSLVIVANGEIYNYIELRAELEKKNHIFSTHSDVENILHLYEDYGIDCVKYLRGMFSFALWDITMQRLLLVRDRMGEKPLYIYEEGETIYFASELKSLLQSNKIKFEFDPISIDLYFHYGYVPEPLTPLKGVRKLPAGHLMLVDTTTWRVDERVYWNMDDIPPLEGNPIKLIREQLEDMSEIVVRSDVPVGVALSGGIDSSVIAVLAARKYPGILQAFSVGYPGRPAHDERDQAR